MPTASWETLRRVGAGEHEATRAWPMVEPASSSWEYGSRTTVTRGLAHTLAKTASSQAVPVQNCEEEHALPHVPQFLGSREVSVQ